uniref:FAD-dependent oxidoreductase n=1 Tax=Piscinibacter sp. TaxID=1903157 RepID=UPI0037841BA0
GDGAAAELWAGLRPSTPDGVPVIGRTPYRNLYLNTGHGTLGWTMAAGTGRLMADLISGRAPAIDMEGLTAERYPRAWRGATLRLAPTRAAAGWTTTPAPRAGAAASR